ncbi:kinesin-domain-containing protein [Trametes versicolor FP-101664 SS1]|uniref:kinesin-domain-containing protein n=1 Tax=Trametes versicolor (strain FP-101664) TaxID=717944 RepID=UPI00046233C2|nr:kinesin-domain-containing protein [Trametes versicolor FP-101664 SS1]EIW64942.1 kinesin-domain-containing protein [Trametes versicolor FP-101664 SS1]
MASKPRAPSTRASTRTKAATAAPAAPARTTRTASKSSTAAAASAPKKMTRKPLVNRANSPESKTNGQNVSPKSSQNSGSILLPPDNDREPIKAYLRIRPRVDEGEGAYEPYLEPLTDTSVRLTDPSSSTSRSRMSTINPSSIYTFSHVFPPDTQQPEFFGKTTLPLVRDVLEGRNGLLFTYGVTNSGKTYTIQGGNAHGSAGILPRTLDVIFNSIEGLHGEDRYRPVRLQGIELASESDEPTTIRLPSKGGTTALADVLEDDLPRSGSADTDPTALKLDRNYEYTIWLSYAEVYNEKVYDLFGSLELGGPPPSSQGTPARGASSIPRPTSSFLNLPVPSNNKAHPLLLTRKALTVKPCPLADGDGDGDTTSAGKYVAGLRQVRVRSAAEAKELLRLGQLHRRVFGTLANSQSSRSHALVTIKVLRVHRGERHDPTSIQTARLTLVDLAGSERTKHTHTSGDRLREAGNINKSLMVLGQCMETLRANQRALARSLQQGVAPGSRLDTRDVKRGLALVPFRHSKLTEVLMDYFVGEGRAVMIVNVNPYDTGFDENVHVMKFSALAREVCTVPATNAARPPPSPTKAKTNGLRANSALGPHRRQVTLSYGGAGRKASEAHLEVLEEDEEIDDGEETSVEDDEPINPLVNALFDEIEELRMQLYDAHIRTALIEAETREEVMGEMEERMRSMEDMFARRLMRVMEHNEEKMDAKLDMIQRSRLLSGGSHVPRSEGGYSDSVADSVDSDAIGQLRMSEHEDAQSSVAGHDADEESTDSEVGALSDSGARSRTPSPLAGKGRPPAKRQSTIKQRTTPPSKGKTTAAKRPGTDDEMDVDATETDDGETASAAEDDESGSELEEDDSDSDEFIDDDDEEEEAESPSEFEHDSVGEWSESEASEVPTAKPAAKPKVTTTKGKASATPLETAKTKRAAQTAARGRRSTRASASSRAVAELGDDLDALSLGGDPDDSTVIIPNRKAREEAAAGTEYVPKKGEVETAKKKKRQLGKGRVMTEDEIESMMAEEQEDGRQLRRSTRGSKR